MAKPPDDWNKKKGTYPNSALDAVPEDKLLTGALLAALDKQSEMTGLIEVLEHTDPNVLRAHSCGTGNALHQAIRWVYVHSPNPNRHEQLSEVIGILVEHGARADQPCEDFDGGVFKSQHYNLWAWLEYKYATYGLTSVGEFVTGGVLPALLTAGAGWGELDKSPGRIGEIVRGHPAWRREHLGKNVGVEVESLDDNPGTMP